MARQKKIEFEIVTTTKIQATIDGKKRTLRMWRLPVFVPISFKNHLKTYFKDAKNEVLCETRTSDEWVDYIKSFKMPHDLRAWVTDVIWWHYGGEGTNSLFQYHRSLKFSGSHRDKKELLDQLDKMGVSKVANDLAADREKRRDTKLKKILNLFGKSEKWAKEKKDG